MGMEYGIDSNPNFIIMFILFNLEAYSPSQQFIYTDWYRS